MLFISLFVVLLMNALVTLICSSYLAKQANGEPSIFLLPIFFATQIIGGAKELVVLL